MKKLNYTELGKLVRRARDGDQLAFGAIYAATYEAQYYLALQILRNPDDAEDALQETYLRLYNSLDRIESPQAMIAYLNKINYNQCLTLKERAARMTAVSSDANFDILQDLNPDHDPAAHLENKMASDQLSNILQSMPEHLRVVLILRYVEQLKLKEIASVLDLSLSTVKRHIKSAKRVLSKLLKESKGGILVAFLFNKELVNMFAESQARLTPSSQTAGSILNHTFSSLSMKDVSFSSCKRQAASVKVPKHSAVLKTAAAAAVAGVTVTGGAYALQNPELHVATSHELSGGSYVSANINASVNVTSPLPVTEFYVCGPDGGKLPLTKTGTSYQFTISQNGTYSIHAANSLSTTDKTLRADSIDKKAPEISDYRVIPDDSITVYFDDNLSGMDWSKTTLADESGTSVPFKIDANNSCIRINYTTDTLLLTVYDRSGNALSSKISTAFVPS